MEYHSIFNLNQFSLIDQNQQMKAYFIQFPPFNLIIII